MRPPKVYYTSVAEWADTYFTENANRLDVAVPIQHAIEAYKLVGKGSIDYPSFISKLKGWANGKGYVYNPEELINTFDGKFVLPIPNIKYRNGRRIGNNAETVNVICVYFLTDHAKPLRNYEKRSSFLDGVTVDYPL